MARQTVTSSLLFGATQSRNNAGIMRLVVGDAQFLDIPRPLYDRVMSGDIDAVIYDDATKPLEIANADGTKTPVQFHRVIDVKESIHVKIAKANKEIEAIESFDQAKYTAAKKKAEGLVL